MATTVYVKMVLAAKKKILPGRKNAEIHEVPANRVVGVFCHACSCLYERKAFSVYGKSASVGLLVVVQLSLSRIYLADRKTFPTSRVLCEVIIYFIFISIYGKNSEPFPATLCLLSLALPYILWVFQALLEIPQSWNKVTKSIVQ